MRTNDDWYRTNDMLVEADDGEFVIVKIHKSIYEMCRTDITGRPREDVASYERIGTNMDLYPDSPESLLRADVPEGVCREGVLRDCKAYPGTSHAYVLYVPAQYDGTQAANLLIVLDRERFDEKMRRVMDNMTADGEIPPTVVLGVSAGTWNDPEYVGPGYPVLGTEHNNDNRSIEFDRIDNVFGAFMINELLPVALHGLNITKDPKKVLVTGFSSGGSCVCVLAYHYPDYFGNIWCNCGSIVAMRGGELIPTAIRQHEKRNFRAYISVGENDLNNIFGDRMTTSWDYAKALEYKGNDFILVINQAGHGDLYNSIELPDVLRWTWGSGALKTRHTRVFTGCAYPIRR